MKTILQLNHAEAREFFLNEDNYFTLDLPKYYRFQEVISEADTLLRNNELKDLLKFDQHNKQIWPRDTELVNCRIIHNKNTRYDWRRFELIHPVLYVDLVNHICKKENWDLITKRFSDFKRDMRIICCSIPLVRNNPRKTILNWWERFEQQSISNCLDYQYMGTTDVENCYPSVYTHAIPWAIHTKSWAKKNRDKGVGNDIDKLLQGMNFGQTNGIPQGSVLMDFIAEIIFGYADERLSDELSNEDVDFKILRYRDDYRVFANEKSIVEMIIQKIALVLSQLNFRLKVEKTLVTEDIILESLKKDKIQRIRFVQNKDISIQNQLLNIYFFAKRYPNSGSVKVYLSELNKAYFQKMEKRPNSYDQIISIIIEIMRVNPVACGICIVILSKVLNYLGVKKRQEYITRILNKYEKEPFSDYLQIWMQRLTVIENRSREYESILCQKVYCDKNIWDSTWLDKGFMEASIIDENVISLLAPVIEQEEVDDFAESYS